MIATRLVRQVGKWQPALATLALAGLAAMASPADSQIRAVPIPAPPPVATYADLADLADPAALVVRAQIRKVAEVEPARAAGLRPGWARLYVEARTEAVLGGRYTLGEALRYLVDVPRDPKGKVPKLKKRSVILFAAPVPGRPGELRLVAPDAQLLADPALEARVKALLAELYAPGAVPRVTGVREAIHVPGNLAGEGETQLFLAMANGEPAAITVTSTPGAGRRWNVSFSAVVDAEAPPPAADSLAWYRLACFLPPQLPAAVSLAGGPQDRQAAQRDYRFVIEQLGPCPRLRR